MKEITLKIKDDKDPCQAVPFYSDERDFTDLCELNWYKGRTQCFQIDVDERSGHIVIKCAPGFSVDLEGEE